MLFVLIFSFFSSADMSGMTSIQLVVELEQLSQNGLKGYESKNDAKVEETARRHGQMFTRAQEFAKAELRAAEKIEMAYRASGHSWTSAQLKQAVDRISSHVNTAFKLQENALKLRGKVFDVFNNVDKPKLYNPARFFRLTKVEGARWLEGKKMEMHVADFTPSSWKLVAYGSPNKPRTTLGGSTENDSFVRKAYSDVYAERHQTKGSPKLETIRGAISRYFSRTSTGTIRKAPGGWMKMDDPMSIGQ